MLSSIFVLAITYVSHVRACADSTTYTFEQLKDGFVRQRKCTWLTGSGDADTTAYRISKFCPILSNGSFVLDECPVSCDSCPTTESPTESPTSAEPTISHAPTSESACFDSSTFTFETINNGFPVTRRCSWLTALSTATEIRIAKWCPTTAASGDLIKDQCRASCDNCPSLPPTIPPTATPTTQPTKSLEPSKADSSPPTCLPTFSPCMDSSTFKWVGVNAGIERTRTCAWLTKDPDEAAFRILKHCKVQYNGSYVKEECPLSCNNCPTYAPAIVASPTPSVTVSVTPTTDPNICSDSSTYVFYQTKDGVQLARKCSWLTGLSSASALRIAKFCPQTFNGSLVQDECKVSCSNCPSDPVDSTSSPTKPPTALPTTGCADSSTYEFTQTKNGVDLPRKCVWLTSSPSMAAARIAKFCPRTFNGSLVQDECKVSCSNCPLDIVDTQPPTAPPSPAVSSTPTTGCTDSSTYEFTQTKNGVDLSRKCVWLTSSASNAAERISKFCPQTFNGSLVQDECMNSCGNCPTAAPSAAPTVTGTICADSSDYYFFQNKNGVEVARKCTWLIDSAERIAKFCPQTSNGSLVQDECKVACSNCPSDGASISIPAASSSSPSESPSNLSSSAPSVHSSSAPSLSCVDSDTFTFIQMKYGYPLERKCSYLTASYDNTAERVAKFCPTTHDGKLVQDECPLSCNNCPTATPTASPSSLTANPSSVGTSSPTTSFQPSTSSQPSISPSILLSSTPTISAAPTVCQDSTTYRFYTPRGNGDLVFRKCPWLTQDATKADSRTGAWCDTEHDGYLVKEQCKLSCNNCT